MDSVSIGDLVSVAGADVVLDGIVFDTPSAAKVVVAVVDPVRGPRFRTVNPNTLAERAAEGADDRALRLLIRRTPPPVRGEGHRGNGRWAGRAGYTRGPMHRTTGK